MRYCDKVGCARQAASTCSFHYTHRQVWIAPLTFDPQPGSYDLCEEHADRFVAPVGWSLSDLRSQSPSAASASAELAS